MKKIAPMLLVLCLGLTACSGPSIDELQQKDPEGYTACLHFGGSLTAPGDMGATNRQKAATHGALSTTEPIRAAVATDSGTPQITDVQAFTEACEAQGFDFDK